MNIKSMTNEELISYRDDILEFFNKENTADCRILQDAHKELLSRLEELENLECCGNCKLYLDDFDESKCTHRSSVYFNYCGKWQSDGMKREDRK